tara:strand:+ start:1334 stop:1702 length:369 start_codon:yes stop_codon:yes gene_type:complete
METTENKVTKIAVSSEEFNNLVNKEVDSMALNFVMSDPSKTAKRLSSMDKTKAQLTPEAKSRISELYRVKGTRAGHINHAPDNVQTAYAEATKVLADNNTWSKDGIDYAVSLIAKAVPVKVK